MTSSTRFRRTAIFVFIPLVLGFVVWRVLRPMALQRQLQNAIDARDYQIIKVLVAQGANPDIKNVVYSNQTSPVRMAIERGDVDGLRFFLRHGASCDDRAIPMMSPPLMLAVAKSDIEAVRVLLSYGANVYAEESHGWTAQFWSGDMSNPTVRRKQTTIHALIGKVVAKTPKPQQ